MELFAIPAAIIIFMFFFRVFVSVGSHSVPKSADLKTSSSKWENHLKTMDMDQPYDMLNHDEEYKQYPEVDGEPIVVDGILMPEYQDRNFEQQLQSGKR